MATPVLYTGRKPVDPLILAVYLLADGQSSTYTVYADSGHNEDYKHDIAPPGQRCMRSSRATSSG